MRRRITLLAAGTALLAVTLLSIPLGALAARGYLRDERLEVEQAAATAAASARGDVTTTKPPRVDSAEIRVSVYDSTGRRLSGPGGAPVDNVARQSLRGRQTSATTADAIVVASPVSDGDQIIAALVLTTNLDAVHQRTLRAWLILAAMAVGAVALSAIAARLVTRRLTAPVDRLTVVAQQVGAGDLTARAARSGITELDTLAVTLNDTVTRIGTMMAKERAFSAEVSHQLRTPLSGLRLELEQAQREATGTASTQIARALSQADRLEHTISEVITLARDLPSIGRATVADVLSAAQARWHGPLAAYNRPLRALADDTVPTQVRISTASAAQILDVLIGNALTHGSGAVTIHARNAGHIVAFDVSDEGPTLALESHQLFRTRRDPSEDPSDTHGIGLPYARKLAEAEGARLVLSRPQPPTFSFVVTAENPDDG